MIETPSLKYRWIILAVITLSHVMSAISIFGIAPLAPFYQQDLNLSRTRVGLFIAALYIGGLTTALASGWLVDLLGVRWILALGQGISGAFIMGLSQITSFTNASVLLFFAGAGHSTVTPATTKAVMDWFPLKERATIMGIKQTGITLGGGIAAASLPVLAVYLGWRYAFSIAGSVTVIAGILSYALYQEYPKKGGSLKPFNVLDIGKLGEIVKRREVLLMAFSGFFFGWIHFATMSYLVLYLKEALSFPVIQAGSCLALAQLGGVLGRLGLGPISDRIFQGRRKPILLILSTISSLMCLLIGLLPLLTFRWLVYIFSLFLGFGTLGWAPLHITLSVELAQKEFAGTTLGFNFTIGYIGIILGPPLFGLVVDITGSYLLAWGSLAAGALLAGGLISRLGRV